MCWTCCFGDSRAVLLWIVDCTAVKLRVRSDGGCLLESQLHDEARKAMDRRSIGSRGPVSFTVTRDRRPGEGVEVGAGGHQVLLRGLFGRVCLCRPCPIVHRPSGHFASTLAASNPQRLSSNSSSSWRVGGDSASRISPLKCSFARVDAVAVVWAVSLGRFMVDTGALKACLRAFGLRGLWD